MGAVPFWVDMVVSGWLHYYTPLEVDVTNSTVFLRVHLRPLSVIVFVLAQIISYLGMTSLVRQIKGAE